MSDPKMIKEIMDVVTIPVMAKARIGHFVECQILEAIGVDYIDESEVLTPAGKQTKANIFIFFGAFRTKHLLTIQYQTMPITSKSIPSPSPSSAAAETSVKHSAVSAKEPL